MELIPIREAVLKIQIQDALEEGWKEGRTEGREAGLVQVARSMLDDGFSPEIIQKYTGLDEEIILSFR